MTAQEVHVSNIEDLIEIAELKKLMRFRLILTGNLNYSKVDNSCQYYIQLVSLFLETYLRHHQIIAKGFPYLINPGNPHNIETTSISIRPDAKNWIKYPTFDYFGTMGGVLEVNGKTFDCIEKNREPINIFKRYNVPLGGMLFTDHIPLEAQQGLLPNNWTMGYHVYGYGMGVGADVIGYIVTQCLTNNGTLLAYQSVVDDIPVSDVIKNLRTHIMEIASRFRVGFPVNIFADPAFVLVYPVAKSVIASNLETAKIIKTAFGSMGKIMYVSVQDDKKFVDYKLLETPTMKVVDLKNASMLAPTLISE